MLEEAVRKFIQPDHPEAPPGAEDNCQRVLLETYAVIGGHAFVEMIEGDGSRKLIVSEAPWAR